MTGNDDPDVDASEPPPVTQAGAGDAVTSSAQGGDPAPGLLYEGADWQPLPGVRREEKVKRDLLESVYLQEDVDTVPRDRAEASLEAVRKRADGWRNGVSATLGLAFAAFSIKGPGDGLGKYTGGTQVVFVGAVLVAVLFGTLSLRDMLRAGNGPSWPDVSRDPLKALTADDYARRSIAATWDLQKGKRWWVATVVVVLGVTIATWVVPPPS